MKDTYVVVGRVARAAEEAGGGAGGPVSVARRALVWRVRDGLLGRFGER